MGTPIATEACTLEGPNGPGADTITVTPVGDELPPPFNLLPVTQVAPAGSGGSAIYLRILYQIITADAYAGAGFIVGSAETVKSGGAPVVLEGAEGDVTVVNTKSPFDSKTVTVKVSDAGQTILKGV